MAEQTRYPAAALAGAPNTARGPVPRRTTPNGGPGRPGMPGRPGSRRPAFMLHPAFSPIALLVVTVAASVYLYGTDPHQSGHWLPRCPFNWTTGLLCPACGATRMVYDLLHGDPVRAFHENALLLIVSPLLLAMGARWLIEGLRGRRWHPMLSARAQVVVLTVAVLWAVLRNLY